MKTLVALILSCFLSVSHADDWTGYDKKLHLGAGLVISSLVTLHTKDPMEGFKWGVVAAGAKELVDATGVGQPSIKDFTVTVIGAAIGAYTGGLIVSRSQNTITISYSFKL